MKIEEIEITIKTWMKICCDALEVAENDCMDTGGNLDSHRWRPVTALIDAYTESVAKNLDADDWLAWFAADNDFGRKGLSAGFDGKLQQVLSAADLAKIIIEYRSRVQKK